MAKRRIRHPYREPVVQPQDQSIKLIALTQGQVTIIDAFKYDWAMRTNWWARWDPTIHGYYALGPITFMHRILIGAKGEERVDHKNGNSLDNRLENLRIVSNFENAWNRKVRSTCKSGYTGIHWRDDIKKWQVDICSHGKRIHLGYHAKWEDALAVRIKAEQEYFGEFALSAREYHQKVPILS